VKDLNVQHASTKTEVDSVISDNTAFQGVKIFSVIGRIGRMRLLAYTGIGWLVQVIVFIIIVTILMALTSEESLDHFIDLNFGIFFLITFFPFIVINLIWCIQRSHDMDWSGWTAILALIPIFWLVWVIKEGTPRVNQFGPPPQPNNLGIKIIGGLSILSAAIGFIQLTIKIIERINA
jgi:uncharacterized membrane protein YhaH (DUF805 family)